MSETNKLYKLKNENNVEVAFMSLGGRILSIKLPDGKGNLVDVVLGYSSLEASVAGDAYFGALCGRYANRIANGTFSIDGSEYKLDCNNGPNHLHGGAEGFNSRIWSVKECNREEFAQSYSLSLVSEDGDQKYPGELKVDVIYGLTDKNEFVIKYEAKTTKSTIINLTSHAYFNLAGPKGGTVADHNLMINANRFTPISEEIGTVSGEISETVDTAMHFAATKPVKLALETTEFQNKLVDGMDHNFVIDDYNGEVKLAATLTEPKSGRKLEVYTDQPGIQIYTGNHFDGTETGKEDTPINKWSGIALETQNFPDAPNHQNFPKSVLNPDETYNHTCIYKFTI